MCVSHKIYSSFLTIWALGFASSFSKGTQPLLTTLVDTSDRPKYILTQVQLLKSLNLFGLFIDQVSE